MVRIKGCSKNHREAVRGCRDCRILIALYYKRLKMMAKLESMNVTGQFDKALEIMRKVGDMETL